MQDVPRETSLRRSDERSVAVSKHPGDLDESRLAAMPFLSPVSRESEHFPQHHEPAAEILDEGPGGFVDEGWGDKRRIVCAGGRSEEEDSSTQPQEGLNAGQELLLDAHGPDADQVVRLVQFGPGEQVLRPHRLHGRVGQLEMADGLAKKGRLPRLGLDHDQMERGNRDLHGDRRRPSS